jgi:hypothetical protein
MNLKFVVPGFSKCGTTTLCSLLGEHPDIFIPSQKEPAYFAYNYHRGWDWYENAFFQVAREGQLCGEGSTFYTAEEFAEVACQRMLNQFPDLKFIFIARHPIKRLESSFREMHHSGYKYAIQADYSIGLALKNLPNMIADTRYWERLNTFRNSVPDERIHVLFLEDLRKNQQEELEKCLEFLGVDPTKHIHQNQRRLNAASEKLYDSRLYRAIQNHAWSGAIWKRLHPNARAVLTKALRLRRPFREAIEWTAEEKAWVVDQLAEDSRAFLQWAGKPVDTWDLAPSRSGHQRAA